MEITKNSRLLYCFGQDFITEILTSLNVTVSMFTENCIEISGKFEDVKAAKAIVENISLVS